MEPYSSKSSFSDKSSLSEAEAENTAAAKRILPENNEQCVDSTEFYYRVLEFLSYASIEKIDDENFVLINKIGCLIVN